MKVLLEGMLMRELDWLIASGQNGPAFRWLERRFAIHEIYSNDNESQYSCNRKSSISSRCGNAGWSEQSRSVGIGARQRSLLQGRVGWRSEGMY
ncbi:hypothetical protein WKW77_27465 [Variovorax ureilyticus]|uniref:Uncharacterized protein n=1 Tax=Variovorax ureilyticus TaxID=1836198 RepID=A0ABU8VMU9_9BURK